MVIIDIAATIFAVRRWSNRSRRILFFCESALLLPVIDENHLLEVTYGAIPVNGVPAARFLSVVECVNPDRTQTRCNWGRGMRSERPRIASAGTRRTVGNVQGVVEVVVALMPGC